MKKFLVAVVTGLALSGQMLPTTGAAQTTQTKKAPPAQVPNTAEFDKQLAQVQAEMKTMQAQMDQVRQTKDPQERQRLLRQHWATMQSAMSAMRGLWRPGMMGGPGMMEPGTMGGWGHMGGYYSNLTPEQLRRRQYMTDQYLNMQQMMMNNMMLHQQYLMGLPASTK